MKKKLLYIFITILFTLTITSGCRLRLVDNGSSGDSGNNSDYYDDTPKKEVVPRSTRATSVEEVLEIVKETYLENNPEKYMLVVPYFVDQTAKRERIVQLLGWKYQDCEELTNYDIIITEMHDLPQEWVDAYNDIYDNRYGNYTKMNRAVSVTYKENISGKKCKDEEYYDRQDIIVKIGDYWYHSY